MLLHFLTQKYNHKIDLINALHHGGVVSYHSIDKYRWIEFVMKPLLTCVTCYVSWTLALSTVLFHEYCNDLYYWTVVSTVVVPICNTLLWAFVNRTIVENYKLYSTITHINPTFSHLNP
jgi:hypothetical protein